MSESVNSMLPLCDAVVINAGNSTDATDSLITTISSPKVQVIHSVWDDSLKDGGRVLAVETDKAFDQIPDGYDWCIYLQADEVIHEQDYPAIKAAMEKYADDPRVEGLLFNYTHFYGSYDYVGDSRTWYSHEIRIIRNDKHIRSYRDAQGFRKNGKKLQVKPVNASICHYGWVRHPADQLKKHLDFEKLYNTQRLAAKVSREAKEKFDYAEIDSLVRFTGTHPAVMQNRVARKNWTFDFDISKKNFSFKNRMLYWIEKKTGKRLWEYQNYTLIR